MKNLIEKLFPSLVILTFVLILAKLNTIPGTILTGGDNLHPEFDFALNIKRSLFGVWQEYQGLGLLSVMGHASDLFRQIFLYLLSFVIPEQSIRYFWAFLTLFIGSLGAFSLIHRLIKYLNLQQPGMTIISLTGGLFYLLNLATLQQYFTPFEVFMTQFALLPWLFLTAINYFKRPNLKNLLLSALALFLATPASYVPTVFVVYVLSLLVVSLPMYLNKKSFKNHTKSLIKYFIVIFIINAFWLLPFLYFVFTNSNVVSEAKQNQIASAEVFLQNKEFGDIWNVMLLKGFWFNNIEPNYQGDYVYMLEPWRRHLSNPLILMLGYSFFGVCLLGLVQTTRKRAVLGFSLAALFIFSITMIATATPPFSWIMQVLRDFVPLFGEVFRFPFTKFSLVTALSYSIFFSLGLLAIASFFKNRIKNAGLIASFVAITALVVFMYPAFKGELFYYRETVNLPKEYDQAFSYLNSKDKNQRIADFPQVGFWEWNFFKWGYSGSGFIWYSLSQPITDRAFDSWSPKNENYYWEMSTALYSNDPDAFRDVLNKYDISYLWYDRARINPASSKSFSLLEFESVIGEVPEIKEEKRFGKISIYKVALDNAPKNFISTETNLKTINKYAWSANDTAFQKYGDYITLDSMEANTYYPFRSALFTFKNQEQIYFKAEETEDSIDFIRDIPESKNKTKINIPSPSYSNTSLPVRISSTIKDSNFDIGFTLNSPSIFISHNGKEKKIWDNAFKQALFSIPASVKFPLFLDVNGTNKVELKTIEKTGETQISTTSFYLEEDNIITISNDDGYVDQVKIPAEVLRERFLQDQSSIPIDKIEKGSKLIVSIPKVTDQFHGALLNPWELNYTLGDCETLRKGEIEAKKITDKNKEWLRLKSKNANACVASIFPEFVHDQGLVLFVENRNVRGRGMHFWLLNDGKHFAPLETYLPGNKKENDSIFVLPPMGDHGKSYSIHFENISIGNDEVVNDLGEIRIYPIPYNFINEISFGETDPLLLGAGPNVKSTHPNESQYLLSVDKSSEPSTLLLSQAYHNGWKAYEIQNSNSILQKYLPFVLGKEIKTHIMVNNWQNGWNLNKGEVKTINIIFLPQYLEYLGLAILGVGIIAIPLAILKRRKSVSGSLKPNNNIS